MDFTFYFDFILDFGFWSVILDFDTATAQGLRIFCFLSRTVQCVAFEARLIQCAKADVSPRVFSICKEMYRVVMMTQSLSHLTLTHFNFK